MDSCRSRQWSRLAISFLLVELVLSLLAVVVFACIFIGDFRMQAWRNGGSEGWNSDPQQRIYYYANHKEPPPTPIIWSDELSSSSLAISIASFVSIAICNLCTRLGYMNQTATFMYYACLGALWFYTLSRQLKGDMSDEENPSPSPWFLSRSCTDAWPQTRGPCHTLRAGVYISLLTFCACMSRGLVIVHGAISQWTANVRGLQDLSKGTATSSGASYHLIVDGPSLDEIHQLQEVEEIQRAQREALSPVLAFFPESPRIPR